MLSHINHSMHPVPAEAPPPSYFESLSNAEKISELTEQIVHKLGELKNTAYLIGSNTAGFDEKHRKVLKSLYTLRANANTAFSLQPALKLMDRTNRLCLSSATFPLRNHPNINFDLSEQRLKECINGLVFYAHQVKLANQPTHSTFYIGTSHSPYFSEA
ncbi:hypothetical protein SC206_14070 [Rouxiella sp. T17]|uniref:hypothetical protein n=1 Tax=Rouxiella sp. T17 TaxID=3085684 RepID=UPI002FCA50F5